MTLESLVSMKCIVELRGRITEVRLCTHSQGITIAIDVYNYMIITL